MFPHLRQQVCKVEIQLYHIFSLYFVMKFKCEEQRIPHFFASLSETWAVIFLKRKRPEVVLWILWNFMFTVKFDTEKIFLPNSDYTTSCNVQLIGLEFLSNYLILSPSISVHSVELKWKILKRRLITVCTRHSII